MGDVGNLARAGRRERITQCARVAFDEAVAVEAVDVAPVGGVELASCENGKIVGRADGFSGEARTSDGGVTDAALPGVDLVLFDLGIEKKTDSAVAVGGKVAANETMEHKDWLGKG